MSAIKIIKTVQKPRWQITLPKENGINKRLDRLMKRYEGMSLAEITKLALIKLDEEKSTRYDAILDDYYSNKNSFTTIKSKQELDDIFEKMSK